MIKITDQTQREIELEFYPKVIVSTVPSQSELLAYLKLDAQVLGITKFCVFPDAWFRTKERVGGTKNLNLEKIEQLKPDLILANKEENDKTQIEYLASKFPTYISDIIQFDDALEMIHDVGHLTDRIHPSESLVKQIKQTQHNFSAVKKEIKSAAYLIWDAPKMVAGSGTFINSMLHIAGFKNVFEAQKRYPEINDAALQNAMPEVVLLSSEPFPFKEKHIAKYQHILPKTKILLVDGTMFSWYGSRLEKASGYFSALREKLATTNI